MGVGGVSRKAMVVLALLATPGPARAQTPPPAMPKAGCRPSDRPETGLQGQVPVADRLTGAAVDGYWCNLDLLGSQGRIPDVSHSFLAAWATLDVYRHCAYYGDSAGLESGVDRGTVVVDISDPAHPKQTAYLTTPAMVAPWESLRVNAKRGLLVADHDAAQVLDVYDVAQDCEHPKLLAAVEMPDAVGHEGFFSPDGLTYWMSSGSNMFAIDLSDPAHPQQLPEPDFSGPYHGGSASPDGRRVYLCQYPQGSPTGTFTDPSSLTIADSTGIQDRSKQPGRTLATIVLPSDFACQSTYPLFYDGHPYVVQYGEGSTEKCPAATYSANEYPRMIDIADETRPKIVAELRIEVDQPANCALIAGDYSFRSVSFAQYAGGGEPLFGYSAHHCSPDRLYNPTLLACGSFLAGLRVFDIGDPLKPHEVAYYNAGTISSTDQTIDDAISRPVILTDRGLIVWTTEFSGLHIARFAPGVLPTGCGSRDDYYYAQYNPDSPCLTPPVSAPAAAQTCDVKIRIPKRLAKRMRSARVLLDGKRTLVLRGRAVRRPFTLRGVRGAHRITVVGRGAKGRRITFRRRVSGC